jgi:hypothetical protein
LQRRVVGEVRFTHTIPPNPFENLIMAECLADYEGTLHVYSRCNAIKSSLEATGILTKLDAAG